MKISILTVCPNGSAALTDTIASVRSQSHADLELVIVAPAQQDLELRREGEASGCVTRWVRYERPCSQAAAWNLGLREAIGDVVGFLRPGSFLHDTNVLACVDAVLNRHDCFAVFGDSVDVFLNEGGMELARYRRSNSVETYRQSGGAAPELETLYVKRQILARAGHMKQFLGEAAMQEFARRLVAEQRNKCVQMRMPLVKRSQPALRAHRNPLPIMDGSERQKTLQPALSLIKGSHASLAEAPRCSAA